MADDYVYDVINNFGSINISPDTLYIFDIDETILYFEEINNTWWNKKFNEYYENNNDYELTEHMCYLDWKEHVQSNDPIMIDEKNLLLILKMDHIFLTARKESDSHITFKHFNKIGINISTCKEKIFHIDSDNKGEFIKNYIQNTPKKYDKYVFVDDQFYNIKDALDQKIPNLKCYFFNKINNIPKIYLK